MTLFTLNKKVYCKWEKNRKKLIVKSCHVVSSQVNAIVYINPVWICMDVHMCICVYVYVDTLDQSLKIYSISTDRSRGVKKENPSGASRTWTACQPVICNKNRKNVGSNFIKKLFYRWLQPGTIVHVGRELFRLFSGRKICLTVFDPQKFYSTKFHIWLKYSTWENVLQRWCKRYSQYKKDNYR